MKGRYIMKVRNLGTDDLRKVCKTLVETDGDVIVTAQTHGLPPEFVKKIKKGEYLPSVTSSFFSPDRWRDPAPGCTEPDPVQLTIDEPPKEEEEMKTETTFKKGRIPTNRTISEETAHKVCELLCDGKGGTEISKILGITATVVSDIRRKKTWKYISDNYFELVGGTASDLKVLKTGTILVNKRNNRRKDYVPTVDEVKKTEIVSVTVETSDENDIINEIINLATKIVGSKKISELPEHIQTKVLEVIKSDIENMSLKEIKELCQ